MSTETETYARIAAEDIIANLNDRRGLGIDNCDAEVQKEIEDCWTALIHKQMLDENAQLRARVEELERWKEIHSTILTEIASVIDPVEPAEVSTIVPAIIAGRDALHEMHSKQSQFNEQIQVREQQISDLTGQVTALQAEHDRLKRTVAFQEEAYLKEHETWGVCKWRLQVADLQCRLSKRNEDYIALQLYKDEVVTRLTRELETVRKQWILDETLWAKRIREQWDRAEDLQRQLSESVPCAAPDPELCDNQHNHPRICHCYDPLYWKKQLSEAREKAYTDILKAWDDPDMTDEIFTMYLRRIALKQKEEPNPPTTGSRRAVLDDLARSEAEEGRYNIPDDWGKEEPKA